MTLLQNAIGPEAEELIHLTRTRHAAWHPLLVTHYATPGRRAVWGKVLAVLAWLATAAPGAEAVLLDADVILRRPIPAGALPAGADFGMVLAQYGDAHWLNSGVIFLRKSGTQLEQFFRAVWDLGPQPARLGCPAGGDQGAIQVALATAAPGLRLALMPPTFNAYTFAPAEDPIIAAFHGLPPAEKRTRIQALL